MHYGRISKKQQQQKMFKGERNVVLGEETECGGPQG